MTVSISAFVYMKSFLSSYPGKSGYDNLASDIVDAFPYLCGGLSGMDSRVSFCRLHGDGAATYAFL